jgi:hypothetical protein
MEFIMAFCHSDCAMGTLMRSHPTAIFANSPTQDSAEPRHRTVVFFHRRWTTLVWLLSDTCSAGATPTQEHVSEAHAGLICSQIIVAAPTEASSSEMAGERIHVSYLTA